MTAWRTRCGRRCRNAQIAAFSQFAEPQQVPTKTPAILQGCPAFLAPDGTYIIVVYELIDDETVYPVTAYEVPEP